MTPEQALEVIRDEVCDPQHLIVAFNALEIYLLDGLYFETCQHKSDVKDSFQHVIIDTALASLGWTEDNSWENSEVPKAAFILWRCRTIDDGLTFMPSLFKNI